MSTNVSYHSCYTAVSRGSFSSGQPHAANVSRLSTVDGSESDAVFATILIHGHWPMNGRPWCLFVRLHDRQRGADSSGHPDAFFTRPTWIRQGLSPVDPGLDLTISHAPLGRLYEAKKIPWLLPFASYRCMVCRVAPVRSLHATLLPTTTLVRAWIPHDAGSSLGVGCIACSKSPAMSARTRSVNNGAVGYQLIRARRNLG